MLGVNALAQTNAYQKKEACRASINQKYKSMEEKVHGKYYYTKPYKGVALAHQCWSGNDICIKHNSRICCTCEELSRKEYEYIERQRGGALQKCEEQYEIESKKEQEKIEDEEKLKLEREKVEREEKLRLGQEKEGKERQEKQTKDKERKDGKTDKPSSKNDEYRNSRAYVEAEHAKYVQGRRVNSEKQSKEAADSNREYMTSILSDPDFMDGSSFVNAHYGLNMSMSVLSFYSIPMYENIEMFNRSTNNFSNQSTTGNASTIYGPFINAELHLLNNKYIDVQGTGGYYRAWSKLGGLIDRDDTFEEFSYGGELAIGMDNIKVLGGYSQGTRNLTTSSFTYLDLANTDMSTYGSASYSFKRLTAGIIFHFDTESKYDKPRERFVKLSILSEKPSYSEDRFMGIAIKARGWLDIGLEYFSKYPTSGTPIYAVTDNKEKAMWGISIAKTMTFFNGRY
ncbi:hypothetical protein [Pedobacter sp. ASV28]|uniref:hypothetical protein n=1 Tax=Pedobacter sp. ASV28 TaxID=2795123 RepID=UPI0018EB4AD1|nr:hypothetical protein [Pedobacter sp. ASV28]